MSRARWRWNERVRCANEQIRKPVTAQELLVAEGLDVDPKLTVVDEFKAPAGVIRLASVVECERR